MTLSALRARPASSARPQKSQTMPSIEADMAYYRRRAAESAARALIASNPGARLSHEELAKLYRAKLTALEAELHERR